MVNVNGIKQWLTQATNSEIRMGLKNAEDMGLEFDDKSIVELFKDGIAVDIVIKRAGENDYLPKRLQKYLENENAWNIDEGFVRIKIIDFSKNRPLNVLETSGLLMDVIPNEFKIASRLEDEGEITDGFSKIRIISVKKDRFLNVKDIRDLLRKALYPDDYEYIVEKL